MVTLTEEGVAASAMQSMKQNGGEMKTSSWGHLHLHTNFSVQDGMAPPVDMVERAARYKQPMIATTDHGVMSGTVKAYKSAKKHGLAYFPGIEAYIIDPKVDMAGLEESSNAARFHLGILARNLKGYHGLVNLSTLSYTRPRYSRFPRLLVDDLFQYGAEYGSDWIITTGCVFGLVERALIDDGFDSARGVLRTLKTVTPNLYVEIQKHNIVDNDAVNPMGEEWLIDEMISLAHVESLPLIATQDCHYLDQQDKSAHALMKRMLYGGSEDEFPGDSFHLCSTGWMQEKFHPIVWDAVERSCTDILNLNELSIPQLDSYTAHVPEVNKTPDTVLRAKCLDALDKYSKADDLHEYKARLDYELDVIREVKMANYFLLVLQCVDYVRSRKVPVESRGSANGSLVLFLLGVTQVDPLIWGTDFDRFMARDRIQAPDVDIDIADKDRHVILEYLENLEINGQRYKTSAIGTYMNLGQAENDLGDTGSAFNTYIGYLKKKYMEDAWAEEKQKAEQQDRKPVKYKAEEHGSVMFNMSDDSKIKTLEAVKDIHPEDYVGLRRIIDMKSVYKSRGKHAGGILISGDDVDIESFVPQMMIPGTKEDSIVTQYTMKDVEQFGLLKMDWLGQTSLSVMSKCMEFLGKEDVTDFSWIPFDDPKVLKFVTSRKNHVGIFHLENYPKSVAMAELKPRSTADFMIHQAYSMPGAADSGAKNIYLARRTSKKIAYDYDHQILHDVFDETLGVMLFQEQVLDVCRGVGMGGTELTNFFSIIKDSGSGAVERNRKRLAEAKPRFIDLSTNARLKPEEIEWVWKQMVAMGGYAFNKAHAAGYGIRSYRTAYLKFYHPVEYMAALLYCWAGSSTTIRAGRQKVKKEDHYLKDARSMGLKFRAVNINRSKANWTVDSGAIRKGFLSVAGIGPAAATNLETGQPYTDLTDLANRAKVSGGPRYLKDGDLIGVLAKLDLIEALDF
jgi:DNA polymerase III subunit alpha